MRNRAVWVTAAALTCAAAGCAMGGASEDGLGDDVGGVAAELRSVPSGVGCVQLTAHTAGDRVRTMRADVTPGADESVTFLGLPAGPAEIVADAFNQGCATLTTGSAPTWLSDPVTVTLEPGRVAEIAFVLRPAVTATGTLDFQSLIVGSLSARLPVELWTPVNVDVLNAADAPSGVATMRATGIPEGLYAMVYEDNELGSWCTLSNASACHVGPIGGHERVSVQVFFFPTELSSGAITIEVGDGAGASGEASLSYEVARRIIVTGFYDQEGSTGLSPILGVPEEPGSTELRSVPWLDPDCALWGECTAAVADEAHRIDVAASSGFAMDGCDDDGGQRRVQYTDGYNGNGGCVVRFQPGERIRRIHYRRADLVTLSLQGTAYQVGQLVYEVLTPDATGGWALDATVAPILATTWRAVVPRGAWVRASLTSIRGSWMVWGDDGGLSTSAYDTESADFQADGHMVIEATPTY